MNDERCVLVRYSRVVYHGVSILFRRRTPSILYYRIVSEYGNISDLGWDPPPAPRPPAPAAAAPPAQVQRRRAAIVMTGRERLRYG